MQTPALNVFAAPGPDCCCYHCWLILEEHPLQSWPKMFLMIGLFEAPASFGEGEGGGRLLLHIQSSDSMLVMTTTFRVTLKSLPYSTQLPLSFLH